MSAALDRDGAEPILRKVIRDTLAMPTRGVDEEPWGGYLAEDVASGAIIGTCAFTARPTEEGVVEIAYFSFPAFERRGYATEMARGLLAIARASPLVKRVIAYTLPERNPSTSVLEKAGLRFDGEIIHPVDGRVWRWTD